MTYVALLRGINVGGTNKVSMKELSTTFDRVGATHVKTYINSGNVIFHSTKSTVATLTPQLEKAIENDFGFPVKVLIRTITQIETTVKALPKHWVNDTTMKCDVLFLWDEIDHPGILDELPKITEYDEVKYVSGALLWKVDKNNVTKSGLLKLVGTKLYKQMTIRNCNTLRKLNTLMSEIDESLK